MDNNPNEIEPIDQEILDLIDHLYSITPTKMKMPEGHIEEVNPEGNIGLFAYGYKGIIAWRKKREAVFGERIYSPIITLLKKIEKNRKEANDGRE